MPDDSRVESVFESIRTLSSTLKISESVTYTNEQGDQDDAPATVVQAMIRAGRTKNINIFDPTPLSHLSDGKLPLEIPDDEVQEGRTRASAILQDLADEQAHHEQIWSDLGLPGHVYDWETESRDENMVRARKGSSAMLEIELRALHDNVESYMYELS